MSLVRISRQLSNDVDALSFGPPVSHVYNPLRYARDLSEQYLERYGQGQRDVVLLGMNPGPWGMGQTGVPFGDPALVREWLQLDGRVGRPDPEHPKRPVRGLGSHRREVSGARLWGWARDAFGTPERFFAQFLVLNYCPLCFLEASGRNRVPERLPASERGPLFAVCDRALRAAVEMLEPRLVVGIGAFAEGRARHVLEGLPIKIGRVLHPSPASPRANQGWGHAATRQLRALDIEVPEPGE